MLSSTPNRGRRLKMIVSRSRAGSRLWEGERQVPRIQDKATAYEQRQLQLTAWHASTSETSGFGMRSRFEGSSVPPHSISLTRTSRAFSLTLAWPGLAARRNNRGPFERWIF